MHPHRVNVFNKTHGYHLVFGITHHFEFEFFPADNRLFNQHLPDETCRKAPAGDRTDFIHIICDTAAGAPHSIRRTDNKRLTESLGNFFDLFQTVSYFASCSLNTQPVHCFFKGQPVFAALNSVQLHPDDLDPVFFQHACLGKFGGKVKR